VSPRVLLITDGAFGDEAIVRCVVAVGQTMPRGWFGVQLRDKHRAQVSLRVLASRLRLVTRSIGAALLINGDARLARDVGADGVHLGGEAGRVEDARAVLGAGAWISVAAHSDAAVRDGAAAGADAVLVSPVFASRPPGIGARAKQARGVGALRSARVLARAGGRRVAVYALGGVDASNAHVCIEAGADGVAVIRALLGSPDPVRVAGSLLTAVRAGGEAPNASGRSSGLRPSHPLLRSSPPDRRR
jgi:thiamine-phosphate pyrophosphorylase